MKIKKKEPDFPKSLHELVKPFIKKIGMFVCTRNQLSDEMCKIKVQKGIIRSNCIDSLDRTNEG